MVIVPVMNSMGLDPQVAASTSSSMIFATTASSLIQYIMFGLLPLDYLLVLVIISACAALVGQFFLGVLVRRTGRTYYLTFIMAVIMVISFIMTCSQVAVSFYNGLTQGANTSLSVPC